ncbi:hypothetical protein TNCV_2148261 [Trichonephila clavipes]|uniref:Uncharacterized protein n=1 Tax=Trichonephila clavipes TaxID=2585209 RepID=A0A8X6T6X2_TRICX|nr:hypothetical protein TNCV_2148261 [Trichonephila clavipes]
MHIKSAVAQSSVGVAWKLRDYSRAFGELRTFSYTRAFGDGPREPWSTWTTPGRHLTCSCPTRMVLGSNSCLPWLDTYHWATSPSRAFGDGHTMIKERTTSDPQPHHTPTGGRLSLNRFDVYQPHYTFPCRNCGGGDRGGVAIYRPFGEFRRAKIALSPVWCLRPTTGVPLAHATMNFVGLDLTTSDRWHQKTTTTTTTTK